MWRRWAVQNLGGIFFNQEGFSSLGLQLGSNSSDKFPWQRCIFCELPHSKDLFRGKYGDVKVVKRKSLPKMMQHFTYLEMVNKNIHITYSMLYTYYIHIIYYSLFLYTIFTYSIETLIYDAMICSNRHLSVMQHLGSMWSFQAVWWFHRHLFHVRTILLQKNMTHFQSIFFPGKKATFIYLVWISTFGRVVFQRTPHQNAFFV